MRVLITGVAGHIESSLAKWILARKKSTKIIGVDDLSCGYKEQVPSEVEFHECDAGAERLRSLFDIPFDAVFHLAAYAAECMSPFCRGFNYRNNLLPLSGLLNHIISSQQDHGRIVFASSVAVYGHSAPPFDEEMNPRPADPYGIAKLACEQDLRVAGEQHGLDWCVIRPRNVYGPGQSMWQRYRNVVGLWCRAALEEKPFVVFGDGHQQRSFTYIDDILAPLWNAATQDLASRQIINLGAEQPVSLLDLHARFINVTKLSLQLKYEPQRHEAWRVFCKTRKSRTILGFEDATPLHDGLRETWAWAKKAWPLYPERRRPLSKPVPETLVGMPEAWQADFV